MAIPFEDSINRTTNAPRWTDEKVADATARDAISSTLRYEGMTVYQIDTKKSYQLQGGITNSDWKEFGGSAITNLLTDTFTATAAQTVFTLTNDPITKNNIFCFIDGVPQNLASFSLSGLNVTLSEGQVAGAIVEFRYGAVLSVGTPGDGTVTTPKIVDANVTTQKIANQAITNAKLAAANRVASTGVTSTNITSTSEVDVTGMTAPSITTTGRPVRIAVVSNGSLNEALLAVKSNTGLAVATLRLYRDSTLIATHMLKLSTGASNVIDLSVPSSVFSHIDTPSAGSYVYKLAAYVALSGHTLTVAYSKLEVMEL